MGLILNDQVSVGYWVGDGNTTEVSDWCQAELFPEGGSPLGTLQAATLSLSEGLTSQKGEVPVPAQPLSQTSISPGQSLWSVHSPRREALPASQA